MKYRYPKSIDTPEGRKVYRRLSRKIKRQALAFKEQSKIILEQIDRVAGLKNEIMNKDIYIRKIRRAVNHRPA